MRTKSRAVSVILSLFLVVVMLVGMTPVSAISIPNTSETTDITSYKPEEFKAPDIINEEEQAEKSYVGRVKEDEKDLYTFVFKNEDGSNTMRVFDHPVKYVDDKGETRDISLEISKDKDGSFKAADHMIKASFGNDISEGIGLEYDDVRIEMVAKSGSIEKAKAGLSDDGKKLTYAIDDKTSYVYSLTYCGIKEDIVVSEYTGQTEYEFILKTNSLHPVKIDESIFLADNDEEIKASIGDIIIFTADNRNNAFGDLEFETVVENGEYKFTIVLDPDYLRDEKTVYPITIDPPITVIGASYIDDVTIGSIGGMESLTSGSLYAGLGNVDGKLRFLMKFKSLSTNSTYLNLSANNIISANICIRDLMCYVDKQIDLSLNSYASGYLPSTWTNGCMSWSSVFTYDNRLTQIGDYLTVFYANGNGSGSDGQQWYSFDATQLVKNWKNGTVENYVAVFRTPTSTETGTPGNYLVFASSDRNSNNPYLTITYNSSPNMTIENTSINVYAWETATIRILNYSNNYTIYFLPPYNSNGISVSDQHDGTCLVTSTGSCSVNISVFAYSSSSGLTSIGVCKIDFELPLLNGYYYIKNKDNNRYVDRLYSLYQIEEITHNSPPAEYYYVSTNESVSTLNQMPASAYSTIYQFFSPYYDAYVLDYNYNIAKKYYIEYLDSGYYTIKCCTGALYDKYLSCVSDDIDYADIKLIDWYDEEDDNIKWRITNTITGDLKLESKIIPGYYLSIGPDDLFNFSQLKRIKLSNYTQNSDYTDEWIFISTSFSDYVNFFKGSEDPGTNSDPDAVAQLVDTYAGNANKTGFTFKKATKDEMFANASKIDSNSDYTVYGFLTHGLFDRILIDSDVSQNTISSLTTMDLWEMETDGFSDVDLVFLGCCLTAFEGDFVFETDVEYPGFGNLNGIGAHVTTSFAHEMYNCGADNTIAFIDSINVTVTEKWTTYFFEEFYRTVDPITYEYLNRTLNQTIIASIDFANDSLLDYFVDSEEYNAYAVELTEYLRWINSVTVDTYMLSD